MKVNSSAVHVLIFSSSKNNNNKLATISLAISSCHEINFNEIDVLLLLFQFNTQDNHAK